MPENYERYSVGDEVRIRSAEEIKGTFACTHEMLQYAGEIATIASVGRDRDRRMQTYQLRCSSPASRFYWAHDALELVQPEMEVSNDDLMRLLGIR